MKRALISKIGEVVTIDPPAEVVRRSVRPKGALRYFVAVRVAGLFLLFALQSASTRAGNVVPEDAQVGHGTNESGTRKFGKALDFDPAEIDAAVQGLTLRRGKFLETRVTSRRDVEDFFGIDASVSARGLWGALKANADYHSKLAFKESSFHYLAYYWAETDFVDLQDYIDLKLDARALEILKQQDPNGVEDPSETPLTPPQPGGPARYGCDNILRFFDTFGTHFWSTVSYGVRYSVLYEFASESTATHRDFGVDVQVSTAPVKLNTGLKTVYDQYAASSELKVSIHFEGVPGDPDCAQSPEGVLEITASDPEVVARNARLLGQCLGQQQGVMRTPFQFGTPLPYTIFPEVQRALQRYQSAGCGSSAFPDFAELHRNQCLTKLYSLWQSNEAEIASRNKAIQLSKLECPLYVFSHEAILTMFAQIREFEAQNAEITECACRCLEGEKHPGRPYDPAACDVTGFRDLGALPYMRQPEPLQTYNSLGDWTLRAVGKSGNARVSHDLEISKSIMGRSIRRVFDMGGSLITISTGAEEAEHVWDLAEDWSDERNPNGVWTYSYVDGGADLTDVGTPFTTNVPLGWPHLQPPQRSWAPGTARRPFVAKAIFDSPTADLPAGKVVGYPGDEGDKRINFTWESPINGTVDILGGCWLVFNGMPELSNCMNWHVILNGRGICWGHLHSPWGTTWNSGTPFQFAEGYRPVELPAGPYGVDVRVGDRVTFNIDSVGDLPGTVSTPNPVAVDLRIVQRFPGAYLYTGSSQRYFLGTLEPVVDPGTSRERLKLLCAEHKDRGVLRIIEGPGFAEDGELTTRLEIILFNEIGWIRSIKEVVENQEKDVRGIKQFFVVPASVVPAFHIGTSPDSDDLQCEIGRSVFVRFVAELGQPPYQWHLVGNLPAGVELDGGTGILSGTPEVSGSFRFLVTARGADSREASATFELEVLEPLRITTEEVLPGGRQGAAYLARLAATGGEEPYSWLLAAGSAPLPRGMALSENGILSGIPEDGGDYSFLVKVTDARRAQFDAKEFILHVEGGCTGEGFPQCLVGRTIAEVAGHFGLSCRPRGDINGDGRQDLSDAVFLLNYLFLGGSAPKPGKALAVDGPGACP